MFDDIKEIVGKAQKKAEENAKKRVYYSITKKVEDVVLRADSEVAEYAIIGLRELEHVYKKSNGVEK